MISLAKQHSYACRCSRRSCQARKRLPRHPTDYIRSPQCPHCKNRQWRVDGYRSDGREQRGHTCRCDGYSFPHFRGRGYCHHNGRLTAEDMRERYEAGAWA